MCIFPIVLKTHKTEAKTFEHQEFKNVTWRCLTLQNVFCTKLTELEFRNYSSLIMITEWQNEMLSNHQIVWSVINLAKYWTLGRCFVSTMTVCVYIYRPRKDRMQTHCKFSLKSRLWFFFYRDGSTESKRPRSCIPDADSNTSKHQIHRHLGQGNRLTWHHFRNKNF